MNANGLYGGVEGYVIPGTNSGVGTGVANGVFTSDLGDYRLQFLSQYLNVLPDNGWSVRRLNEKYKGPIMTVSTLQVGDNANAEYTLYTDKEDINLYELSVANGGNLYVKTLFDQFGGNNMIVPSTVNKPQIVQDGVVNLINGKLHLIWGPSLCYFQSTSITENSEYIRYFVGTRPSTGITTHMVAVYTGASASNNFRQQSSRFQSDNNINFREVATGNLRTYALGSTAIGNLIVGYVNRISGRQIILNNQSLTPTLDGFVDTLMVGGINSIGGLANGVMSQGSQMAEVLLFRNNLNDIDTLGYSRQINRYYNYFNL
jgi:hypothetical protein